MASSVFKDNATNTAGAIAHSLVVPAGVVYRIITCTLKMGAAPTTSENYTITVNANAGAAFDTQIYSLDLSTGSTTDNIWFPDGYPLYLEGGDALDIAYANTDANTYASQITVERV
jgi:hypothetical protein